MILDSRSVLPGGAARRRLRPSGVCRDHIGRNRHTSAGLVEGPIRAGVQYE